MAPPLQTTDPIPFRTTPVDPVGRPRDPNCTPLSTGPVTLVSLPEGLDPYATSTLLSLSVSVSLAPLTPWPVRPALYRRVPYPRLYTASSQSQGGRPAENRNRLVRHSGFSFPTPGPGRQGRCPPRAVQQLASSNCNPPHPSNFGLCATACLALVTPKPP